MQDFGSLLEAHDCADGQCSDKWTHVQAVLVSPDDVATPAAEIRMLIGIRDQLTDRGFTMREGEPTPRFDGPDDVEPKSWTVTYHSSLPSVRAARLDRPRRVGFVRRLRDQLG